MTVMTKIDETDDDLFSWSNTNDEKKMNFIDVFFHNFLWLNCVHSEETIKRKKRKEWWISFRLIKSIDLIFTIFFMANLQIMKKKKMFFFSLHLIFYLRWFKTRQIGQPTKSIQNPIKESKEHFYECIIHLSSMFTWFLWLCASYELVERVKYAEISFSFLA